jgi:MFS family permease
VGIWAGVSAIALGLGPLLGGAIVEAASWRWVFLVNLPVVAAGAAIVALATPESRDPSAPRRIDARGLVLLAVGLGSLVLGIVQGRGWGWDSAATLGAFALAALALTALVVVERRVPAPIVDLSLFRNGPYFGASAAAFTLVGSYWTIIFLQPQTMQSGLGFSALEAGALVLPLTAPMVVLSPLGGRLTARFGARGLMTFGMALATAGCLWLTQVDAAADAWDVVPGSLLFGVALGLVYAPMSTAAMVALPAAKAGIAAGVLAMVRVLAGALFLAIGGALFARALLDDAGAGPPEAYAEALGSAMWLPALLCGAGTVLTWCFVRGAADEATASGGAHHHRRHRFHF